MAEVEIGNLKILNVTKTIAALTEETFKFSVPPGGVGLLKEATYHLLRSASLAPGVTATAGQTSDVFTSELIRLKSLEVTKVGASERVNLLSGTPNIKEFAGDGRLSKLFTVIETLENNEDILTNVRNDDAVDVEVSLTLWLAVKPRERRIAAQPAMEPQ
jgi:hypothetical protein